MQNQPKFIVKFNNGYWKVFDTLNYKDKAIHILQKQAIHHAEYLNSK